MRGVKTAVGGLGGALLAVWQPLKGERWPLELLYEEAVVEETCILHPDGVLVRFRLWVGLHGANINKF